MIESSFLCSGSWDSDLFQDFGDGIPSVSESEDCINSLEKDSSMMSSCCTTTNDLSWSSSDSDDLNFKTFFPITESAFSRMLAECPPIEFGEAEWSALLNDPENFSTPLVDSSAPVKNSLKKRKKSRGYLSTKPWSKLSPEDQLKTLHALSEIVTYHMGIREQIEVIKIIDPSVTISPDDTEFALDGSSLNDAKMKRIRDFVHKRGFSLANSRRLTSSSTNSFTSDKSSVASKLFSRKSTSRTKKRQKKQKICKDEDSRQKRKLELHGQKEAQSGLFVYEKVIKKLSNPMEEDEDVNILE